MSIQDATRASPPRPSQPALGRGTRIAPTFSRPAGTLSFWPKFQTTRARKEREGPQGLVFTGVCMSPALKEQKHHAHAVSPELRVAGVH